MKVMELSLVPGTKTPEEKIRKAEDKLRRAERAFNRSGEEEDRIEMLKAMNKLEETRKKAGSARGVGVKVGRNRRGEVVIVK